MHWLMLGVALHATRPPAVDHRPDEWYGWQTLLADGVGFAAQDAKGSGFVVALVGPNIVHLVHHRPGAAVVSALVRIAAPMFAMASIACPEYSTSSGSSRLTPGNWACAPQQRNAMWTAWSAVALFDAAVLAWE
ncbi:MAG: hypothetical protein AAB426_13650 [Myxococcota bacterium]|mgnify:FL=1